MTVAAILPALNAARYLGPLLDEIRERHPDVRCVVVDDGSTDGTADTARTHGAEVLVHEVNRGKGAALMTGFAWAADNGIDWVLTLDSDGQHLPADMGGFLDRAAGDDVDVIVGNRMADPEGMPWIRRVTNRFTSSVVGSLAGARIPDSQNGYRMIRVASLDGVRVTTVRYDFESEILVRLARRGARVDSVPTASVYGDEQSSINPIRDTVRFFRLAWRLSRDEDAS